MAASEDPIVLACEPSACLYYPATDLWFLVVPVVAGAIALVAALYVVARLRRAHPEPQLFLWPIAPAALAVLAGVTDGRFRVPLHDQPLVYVALVALAVVELAAALVLGTFAAVGASRAGAVPALAVVVGAISAIAGALVVFVGFGWDGSPIDDVRVTVGPTASPDTLAGRDAHHQRGWTALGAGGTLILAGTALQVRGGTRGSRPREASATPNARPRTVSLDDDYGEAWEEWATRGRAREWESTATDGLTDSPGP